MFIIIVSNSLRADPLNKKRDETAVQNRVSYITGKSCKKYQERMPDFSFSPSPEEVQQLQGIIIV